GGRGAAADGEVAHNPVPARHPWRWVSAVAVLAFVAFLARSVALNKNIRWELVRTYLFDHLVLQGVVATLELTGLAMVIGLSLGVLLAVMRQSPNAVLQAASGWFIWLFRGTPVLVQIIFWFSIALVFPTISIGIPFGPTFASVDSVRLLTPFLAAVVGLGLNEGAYMAEIVRAGILSVDEGQNEAAMALGLKRTQIMRRIVLPQAMRVIVPPIGNETISMLKTTSIVVIVGYSELTTTVQGIAAQNLGEVELLMVASLWYLAITSVLSIAQYFIERRFARGAQRQLPRPMIARLAAGLFPRPRLNVGDSGARP
ncbi:MAG: polar amino acid transport system permease protein, partial [Frankiaceae bacterium]|nr:polar amino acid transport system permease protein [Frankiaceae bacterium]